MKPALALFLLSSLAFGQDQDLLEDEEPIDGLLERSDPGDEYERAARIFLRGIYYGEADLDENGGNVSIKEWGIGGWHRWPLIGGNGAFGVGLQYGNRKYDFGGGAQLGGIVNPFDHVEDLRLTGFYEALINDEWSWFAAGTLALGAEDGVDLDDGFYVEGAGGFLFQVQDGMQLGLGHRRRFGASPRSGCRSAVIPAPREPGREAVRREPLRVQERAQGRTLWVLEVGHEADRVRPDVGGPAGQLADRGKQVRRVDQPGALQPRALDACSGDDQGYVDPALEQGALAVLGDEGGRPLRSNPWRWSGGAWSGLCEALKATYSRNGSSFFLASARNSRAKSPMAWVV